MAPTHGSLRPYLLGRVRDSVGAQWEIGNAAPTHDSRRPYLGGRGG
jgi:hypothetical protein